MHPAEQRSIIVTLRRVASTIIQARNRDIRHLLRQLDDRDGRRDASWPSRMNVPVSTLNVGVTAIDVPGRPPAPAPATGIGSGRAVRRRPARSRLHLTQTRVDPGSPSRQARFFSRRRELICAIRIGPRENSPACAFRVNPRR
jgi:hypothetical protein